VFQRINLDQLEECITTLAEFLELKGDPGGLVEGHIIETRTDTGRGKMATILVQKGTLKKGDYLIAGLTWTKVRMKNNVKTSSK
jgi:translation initiation factor IF-2